MSYLSGVIELLKLTYEVKISVSGSDTEIKTKDIKDDDEE